MEWNNTLYDQQHGFISKYGEGLIDVLHPEEGEKILDLGCGTGDLANEIAKHGCQVVGIDGSEEMISAAREKFPELTFLIGDVRILEHSSLKIQENEWDAVFSNAVLHWIKEPEKVLSNVNRCLRKGGRFVAEFGGKGNVEKIRNAIYNVLWKHGYKEQAEVQKWYFPSVAEYAELLEKYGFEIRQIGTYDRPTVLKDTEHGLVEWLEMFGDSFFENIIKSKKQELLEEMKESLRDELYKNGKWIADYKRLRFYAVKNSIIEATNNPINE